MANEIGENELAFCQIGMNSNDIVATLRLYSQLFGFSNAGGAPAWGDNLRVQGLGADATMMMWWMVGVSAGLVLGAIIRRGERVRTEQFLTYVFGSIEALQTSRS